MKAFNLLKLPVVILLMVVILVSYGTAQEQNSSANRATVYNVLDYGIRKDSITLNTAKIQQLIDQVAETGGGTLYFPPGKYLTGTIYLKSHIILHIESGASILGSLDIDDYEAVGEEKPNHSARQQRHLIYAGNAEGIAITGRGTIDGRGYEFWPEDFRNMSERDIRAAMTNPDGFSSRPGTYVMIRNCTDVLLENIKLKDSPHHMIKVLGSKNVVIRGITIEQGIYEDDGPNTDGLAVSGFNIRISDCSFTTGDDCLVIGNTEHFTLNNSTFTTTESAIVLSELRNGTIGNCNIFEAGAAINIRPRRGERVEHVTVNNINYVLSRKKGGNLLFARSKPVEVRNSVKSWAERWNIDVKPQAGAPPVVRHILFSNIIATSDGAIFIDGLEDEYVEDITFQNIRYNMRGGREKSRSANPPHPFHVFGHNSAPYGIFCRYVKDITFKDIRFTWNEQEEAEWGSAIRFENAVNVEIDGFKGRQSLKSEQPAIGLQNVNDAFIHNCRAAEETGTFLGIAENCKNILFMNSDMRNASETVRISGETSANQVIKRGLIFKHHD